MGFLRQLAQRLRDPGALRARLYLLVALAFSQTLLVWSTQTGYGLTWDEAVHIDLSEEAVRWLRAWTAGALETREDHTARWGHNWEFLPVPRLLHGTSDLLFRDAWFLRDELFAPLIAYRMLNGLVHGLNCWLIGAVVLRLAGLWPAAVALVAYGSLPRVFGHAHLAATETVMVTMTMLVTFAFMRSMRQPRFALVTGLVWGLGMSTKFNLLMAPLWLWPWGHWHHRARVSSAFMAMVFLSPLVWIISWPWLWTDTIAKIIDFLDHFLVHGPVPVLWRGAEWGVDGRPVPPWQYPIDLIRVTTPIPTLILGGLGWLWCLASAHREGRWRLMAMMGLVPLAIASLPMTPKYDGVRLFLPVFASLAICLGLFLSVMINRLVAAVPVRHRSLWHDAAWGVALLVCAAPGYLGIARIHPSELSYFNGLIGGVTGAEAAGYEVTYWGDRVNEEVIMHLNETLPPGTRLYPMGMRHATVGRLTGWEILRPGIEIEYPPLLQADAVLIQNRRAMLGPEARLLWERALERGTVWRIPAHDESGSPAVTLLRTPDLPSLRTAQGGERIVE